MKYLKLYENFDELKITLLNSIDDLNKKEEAGEFSASDFDSGFKYLSIGVDLYATMKYQNQGNRPLHFHHKTALKFNLPISDPKFT